MMRKNNSHIILNFWEAFKEKASGGESSFELSEASARQLRENGYFPSEIFASRQGYQTPTSSATGGLVYSPRLPEGPATSVPQEEYDDGLYNPFAKSKGVVQAESRLRKLLRNLDLARERNEDLNLFLAPLRKYQTAAAGEDEYQVYHSGSFHPGTYDPFSWRNEVGRVDYQHCVDSQITKINSLGSSPVLETSTPSTVRSTFPQEPPLSFTSRRSEDSSHQLASTYFHLKIGCSADLKNAVNLIKITEVPEALSPHLAGAWKTSEQLFQASKYEDEETINKIRNYKGGLTIAEIQTHLVDPYVDQVRTDWSLDSAHLWSNQQKFANSSALRSYLLSTLYVKIESPDQPKLARALIILRSSLRIEEQLKNGHPRAEEFLNNYLEHEEAGVYHWKKYLALKIKEICTNYRGSEVKKLEDWVKARIIPAVEATELRKLITHYNQQANKPWLILWGLDLVGSSQIYQITYNAYSDLNLFCLDCGPIFQRIFFLLNTNERGKRTPLLNRYYEGESKFVGGPKLAGRKEQWVLIKKAALTSQITEYEGLFEDDVLPLFNPTFFRREDIVNRKVWNQFWLELEADSELVNRAWNDYKKYLRLIKDEPDKGLIYNYSEEFKKENDAINQENAANLAQWNAVRKLFPEVEPPRMLEEYEYILNHDGWSEKEITNKFLMINHEQTQKNKVKRDENKKILAGYSIVKVELADKSGDEELIRADIAEIENELSQNPTISWTVDHRKEIINLILDAEKRKTKKEELIDQIKQLGAAKKNEAKGDKSGAEASKKTNLQQNRARLDKVKQILNKKKPTKKEIQESIKSLKTLAEATANSDEGIAWTEKQTENTKLLTDLEAKLALFNQSKYPLKLANKGGREILTLIIIIAIVGITFFTYLLTKKRIKKVRIPLKAKE